MFIEVSEAKSHSLGSSSEVSGGEREGLREGRNEFETVYSRFLLADMIKGRN